MVFHFVLYHACKQKQTQRHLAWSVHCSSCIVVHKVWQQSLSLYQIQWLLKKFYLENTIISSDGLRELHQCQLASYFGVIYNTQTLLFLKSYFVFSNITKDILLLLVISLIKRYNKTKYNYSNSTNSYGVPVMCLALWMDILWSATEPWICYSFTSCVDLTYFTTDILCNVPLLWRAIITMFFLKPLSIHL